MERLLMLLMLLPLLQITRRKRQEQRRHWHGRGSIKIGGCPAAQPTRNGHTLFVGRGRRGAAAARH
jgi:hypothetical protein